MSTNPVQSQKMPDEGRADRPRRGSDPDADLLKRMRDIPSSFLSEDVWEVRSASDADDEFSSYDDRSGRMTISVDSSQTLEKGPTESKTKWTIHWDESDADEEPARKKPPESAPAKMQTKADELAQSVIEAQRSQPIPIPRAGEKRIKPWW
jgi:hypothetical protein